MSFTNFLTYVIVLILIIITVINLYVTLGSKKRKQKAISSYQNAMLPVEKSLLELEKQKKLKFDKVKKLVNDEGSAIIFVSDTKQDFNAIAMKDDLLSFRSEELKNVRKLYEEDGKKISFMKIEVLVNNVFYTYTIASRPFNPKGFFGKVLYEDADTLFSLLSSLIKIKS